MVLINGVKYACERCIRGHRVTTCTHTDQPLMMIKPKGRPSTQCPFCKEQRRIRNAHVNCVCSKKTTLINGKIQVHDNDCPCHVSGECTCCNKSKKLTKKKDKDATNNNNIDKPKDACCSLEAKSSTSKRKNIKKNSPKSIQTPTPTNFSNLNSSNNNSSIKINGNILSPSLTDQSLFNMNDISSQPLISNLYNDHDGSINSDLKLSMNDKDTSISAVLEQPWDMSSPPMGNSESVSSLMSANVTGNTVNSNNSYYHNNNNNNNNRFKRQIGLDPLQNFRSSSNSSKNQPQQLQQMHQQQLQQQRGLGEISIPVDEYIKPLNKMNVHFNNFLNNLSDSSPTENVLTSPNSISPTMDTNLTDSNNPNYINNNNYNNSHNHNHFANQQSNNVPNNIANQNNENINNFYNPNNAHNSGTMFGILPPTPGNGLLDIFEDSAPTPKIYRNASNSSVLNNNNNNNNYNNNKNNNNIDNGNRDNEPDSLFPLFPLIGPTYSSTSHNDLSESNKLSHSNLNNFNMKPSSSSQNNLLQQAALNNSQSNQSFTQLYQNTTGSSTHSSNQSFYSLHSLHSDHSLQRHHHHHHHHNHIKGQGSFQPYPSPQPRRSNSFLSISSSNTVSSANSPAGSFAEQPQLLTADTPDEIQEFTGPQLTNAKTNTTLMDDIYQTKTYTDAQSVASSKRRQSIANQQQQNLNLLQSNNPVSDETYAETLNPADTDLDFSLIGTVPMTSSLFLNQNKLSNNNNNSNNKDNIDQIDQYDKQLFDSLMNNNF